MTKLKKCKDCGEPRDHNNALVSRCKDCQHSCLDSDFLHDIINVCNKEIKLINKCKLSGDEQINTIKL